jgi:hypothetical protein
LLKHNIPPQLTKAGKNGVTSPKQMTQQATSVTGLLNQELRTIESLRNCWKELATVVEFGIIYRLLKPEN